MIVSASTRKGPVATVVLFVGAPGIADARVIFEQRAYAADVGALWRATHGLGWTEIPGAPLADAAGRCGGIGGDAPRMRATIPERLLSVEWPMPDALRLIGGHATLLTLTFEPHEAGSWLTLTHAGFGRGPEWDEGIAWHRQFWPCILRRLDVLLGG